MREQRSPVVVVVRGVSEPRQDLPQDASDQVGACPVEQLLRETVDVGDPSEPVEREDAARESVGRLPDDGSGAEVDEEAGELTGRAVTGRPGPAAGEFEEVRPAVGAAQPQPAYDRAGRCGRPAGDGAQPAHVLRGQQRRQRVDGARELCGIRGEDRAQLRVRVDDACVEVPLEVSDPDRWCDGRGQLDGYRLTVPHDLGALARQLREVGAELPGHVLKAVPVGRRYRLPGCGRAKHRQDPEPLGAADRHEQRPERERQARHQLREPAHGLLGIGEHDRPVRAVGLTHREGPVHIHAPPGAEQPTRQPREHREPQQLRVPGA